MKYKNGFVVGLVSVALSVYGVKVCVSLLA